MLRDTCFTRKLRELFKVSPFKLHLSAVYRRFPSRVAKLPDAIRISRVVKCGYAVNQSENFDDVPNCLRYTTPPSRQTDLTLARSCVSNSARGANPCVLYVCVYVYV